VLDCDDRLSPNQLDVGVDSNDFRPISYQEVKEKIIINHLNKLNKC
jgi:calcineurin-like phosphoesterase family protein